MEWKDLMVDCYDSTLEAVERAIDGLTQEDLNWQPRPDCNSIGWTIWHLTRALDGVMSSLMGEEELWTKNGWCSRFNRAPDATDTGSGHGPEQLAAFKCPDIDTLLGYHRAALERAKSCLAALSSSDLSRQIDDSWSQLFPSVGSRLVLGLDELLQHAGQVGYIRGLLHGKGWQEF